MKPLVLNLAMCALVSSSALPVMAATVPSLSDVLSRWDQDEHPDLRGVVVLRDGRPIAERYYNGAIPDELHDIRSAGKSVTALLVGIAIDRGAIRSVDDSVAQYWTASADSAIGTVPLRDVLTMRSGLAAFDGRAAPYPFPRLPAHGGGVGALGFYIRRVEGCASDGVQLWPILQDVHQLRALYGQRAGTFLSNAGVLQVFGVNDQDSAKLVSDLAGQETVVFETMSRAIDAEESGLSYGQQHVGPCSAHPR